MAKKDKGNNSASTREKLLHLLKCKGPQTATELAEELAVTPVAVRQHLQILVEEGLLESSEERQPVGRPARRWHLSDAAREFFPDSHGKLVSDLLGAIGDTFGEDGLRKVVEQRTARVMDRYRSKVLGANASLAQRVKALTAIRNDEGYMAECRANGGGSWLLIENHCPIGTAAESCGEFCTVEPELFRSFLGEDVEIRRTEHIMSGNRRCVYEISKR